MTENFLSGALIHPGSHAQRLKRLAERMKVNDTPKTILPFNSCALEIAAQNVVRRPREPENRSSCLDPDRFLFLLYDRLERIPSADIDYYMPLKKAEPLKKERATWLPAWLRRMFRPPNSGVAKRSRGEQSLGKSAGWPFADPENVAVFTVADICEGRAPILRVCRDREDGAWQFHTGAALPDESQWRLLSLREIVKRDPSVKEVADLPLDWEATRTAVNERWITQPQRFQGEHQNTE